jgi:superfamily II DNA/RNA helicase
MNFKDSVPHFISRIQHNFENDSNLPQLSKNAKELTISESETESNSVLPEPQIKPNKIRTNQFFGLETEELTSRKNSGEIPQVLRKLEEKITDSEKPTDLLLATNMLAVGVDISRLGVMMVNGQPKNHSEYIQATGRIGRQNPGLIVTIYSYTKPRDLSHYENFKIYHSSYYKNVETVSLTPFTIRCREIALFGVLVGILRMKLSRLSKNTDAKYFDPKDEDQMKIIDEIKLVFKKRVEDVDPSEQERTMKNIEKLLTRWSKYKKLHGDLLEYREISVPEASKVKKAQKYYLLKSDLTSTRQLIPVPQSLRNAENEQNLFYHQQSEVLD